MPLAAWRLPTPFAIRYHPLSQPVQHPPDLTDFPDESRAVDREKVERDGQPQVMLRLVR